MSISGFRLILAIGCCLSMGLNAWAGEPALGDRQHGIAQRGAQIMPFDLEKTMHAFNKSPQGGLQEVLAKDPADAEQIRLIRAHLSQLAESFGKGDFSAPAGIHGADMPGLAELQTAGNRIRYRYREMPAGAAIDYETHNPPLVDAIHRYFNAQLMDHGRHAHAGHMHGTH